MRKLFLSVLALLFTSAAFADRWDSSLEYRTSKDFDQFAVQVQKLWTLNFTAGLGAKISDEDGFKDPIYSLYLPLQFDGDMFKIAVTPFYYFNSKLKENPFVPYGGTNEPKSSAFGANARVFITLQDDAVNDIYTHAYLGAGFVRQKGILAEEKNGISNRYYSQLAYTLGLHKNFFRAFSFEVAGNVFHYPDGINGVKGLYGVFNQEDLSSIQSLDITHELPTYTVGTRLTRLWPDRQATLYVAYHFEEFHTADSEHSILLGNTFALKENITADIAYNHLRTIHNEDKRDIFYAQIHFLF